MEDKQKTNKKLSEKLKKLHGARRSKVDPKMMTVLQHEAHKLRIFKLTMSLFLICVVIGAIVGLFNYFNKEKEATEYIAKQKAKLATYEQEFRFDRPYESAVSAVRALRLAEHLIDFGITRRNLDLQTEMQGKIKQYNKVIAESFPKPGKNYVSPICYFDMVWIPSGNFAMGSTEKDGISMPDERPQRQVSITKPFWISRKEVDIWQFRKLVPAFCIPRWNGIQLDKLNYPVGRVTWEEAMFFCQKLTSEERRRGIIPQDYEYRLPTEAEWEYCARGGTKTIFYWGNEFAQTGTKYANSLDKRAADKFGWRTNGEWSLAPSDPFSAVAPTGSFQPNQFGLYDMLGNVSEWCFDSYDPAYYVSLPAGEVKDVVNTTTKTVEYTQFREFDAGTVTREIPCKVIRGGNWGNVPEKLRCAARDFMPQNESNNGVGFRIVLAPVISTKISNAR